MQLQHLYSHRSDYQSLPKSNNFSHIILDQEILEDYRIYAKERMHIYNKKSNWDVRPRTNDPILANYRFCNVYRELDKQTLFIHEALLPHKHNFKLWFLNLMIFRCIESSETFSIIWLHNGVHCDSWFHKINNTARPRFWTAYIFPPQIPKKCGYNTREERLAYFLPTIVDNLITEITSWHKMWVIEWVNRLIPIFWANLRFHITEFLIDISYQYPQFIDLRKPFHIGPGALPTMKLLYPWAVPSEVCEALIHSQPSNFPYLMINEKPVYLSAEAIEWLACEFRKYRNLRDGRGRKRKY